MCLFMEAVFGAKASPIFRERMLPRCMLSDTYVESPGLPDEDDQSARAALEAEIKHMEMTLRSHANGSADQGVGGTRVFYQTHRERGHCQGGGVRGGENHR